jgi:hypothetical protein
VDTKGRFEKALEIFSRDGEADQRQALEQLIALSRDSVQRYLRDRMEIRDESLRQDLTQETFIKIWDRRAIFRNQGVAAWHGLLRRVAGNCYYDTLRRRRALPQDEEWLQEAEDESWTDEWDAVYKILTDSLAGRLYYTANLLWLGLDPTLSAASHDRQFLAAQLYYLEGWPWNEVLDFLKTQPPPEEPTLNRDSLLSWLRHPGVLRLLAFRELYYSNDRLAAHLLGFADSSAQELDRVMQRASALPLAGFTWEEAAVILWRYRYNKSAQEIEKNSQCTLTLAQITALLDSLTPRQPFSSKMESLLEHVTGLKAQAQLDQPDLWQRLTFQYGYSADELPQRDILERVQPPAQRVDYALNEGQLNVWLSGKRLLKSLVKHYVALWGTADE